MAEHAERMLQPSSFKRTINCPGWGQLCKNIPPKPSSKYALEGTAAHYLAEKCLKQDQDADHMLGKKITVDDDQGGLSSHEVTEDMAEAVQVYLDEVRRKRAGVVGGIVSTEARLDLGWLAEGMSGTGDHVIVEPLGCIYVDDYKHGAGVAVEVEDNPQLMIYALGALGEGNPHMVEEIEVTIVQPRAPHPHGPVRFIRYDVEDLLTWAKDVLVPAVKAAQTPGAPLCAGEWCKWCDGLDVCPETRKLALQAADAMFDGDLLPVKGAPGPPEPCTMDSKQMDRLLRFSGVFEDWLKAVREEAYDRLEKGSDNAPTEWKLVQGRLSNRAWQDGLDVAKELSVMLERDDIFVPEKVNSPTQIEKALKKKSLTKDGIQVVLDPLLAERKPGKPLMVPITDGRQALPPSADRMFDDDNPLS